MMHASHLIAGAALVAVAATSWSRDARADEGAGASTPEQEETLAYVKRTPNENLIAGGAFLFLTSYGFSAVAAAKSDLPVDNRLYIPLAGPWMNLRERPPCGPGRLQPSCKTEPLNEGLLIT